MDFGFIYIHFLHCSKSTQWFCNNLYCFPVSCLTVAKIRPKEKIVFLPTIIICCQGLSHSFLLSFKDAISRSQDLILNPVFKILLHKVTTLQDEFQCVSIMLWKDKPKQIEKVVNLHGVNIKICNILFFYLRDVWL